MKRKQKKLLKKLIPAAALLVLMLLTLFFQPSPEEEPPAETTVPTATYEPAEDFLYVHFIDVGQADCTLLKVGDCDILIDGGNVADGAVVADYLARQGVDDLELVISTHAHEDHAGGLTYVLKKYIAEEVWAAAAYYSSNAYTNFVTAVENQGLPLTIPSLGDTFTYGDLTLTVLGPVEEYDNTNNTSIVVMAQYGGKRFLFTGDMETDAEADLIASGADLHADVLKVGHHGSYTASSTAFLDAVGAQYGVIHVGTDNDYGHPHTEAMNRLLGANLALYRTDLMGNIVIATDGAELVFMWDHAEVKPQTAE